MGVPGRHHERVPYRMALVHDDDQSGKLGTRCTTLVGIEYMLQ